MVVLLLYHNLKLLQAILGVADAAAAICRFVIGLPGLDAAR